MTTYEAITTRRTIRKFEQKPLPEGELEKLVLAAHLAPSGANLQPLKYRIVSEESEVNAVFPLVHFAAYLAPHGNPKDGEHPVAYIIITADISIRKTGYDNDAGAAAENLMLAAWEDGIGSCWMGAIERDAIAKVLHIDQEKTPIHTLIALGYPKEESETCPYVSSIKYYKDQNGKMWVPKRSLEEILLPRM